MRARQRRLTSAAWTTTASRASPPRPPPFPPHSRTNWIRLVPPSVLTGHVSFGSGGGAHLCRVAVGEGGGRERGFVAALRSRCARAQGIGAGSGARVSGESCRVVASYLAGAAAFGPATSVSLRGSLVLSSCRSGVTAQEGARVLLSGCMVRGSAGGGVLAVHPGSTVEVRLVPHPVLTGHVSLHGRGGSALPSRTDWARLVPHPDLPGHVSSLSPY